MGSYKKNHKAFTLAEVLITLGIIGVVAALTIPALINRNEERVRETQLKKVYSILAQVHQMMIVSDIYPYPEFVEPFIDVEQEETSSDNNSGNNENEQPNLPPVDPNQPDNSNNPSNGGDENSNTSDPSVPNMSDKRTKELVDGLIRAAIKLDFTTVRNNYNELKSMYGTNNLDKFLEDYFSQSGWTNNNLSKYAYMNILANLNESSTDDNANENFVRRKQYQLQVLKNLLNNADYCESYDKCSGGTEAIVYKNLTGTVAKIEAAEFENNALKLNDGMYLWLGDINNPQRYFIDINGSKRPNKLGVDVFTFDITPKNTIAPEKSNNCTVSGALENGEEYRGLGCSGYALTDLNPDSNLKGYWKNFK